MNRRGFMRSALYAASTAALSAARKRTWAHASRNRPFCWRDAANRTTVERAVFSPSGDSVVLHATRPLSAGGEYLGRYWPGVLDPRGELWLLGDRLRSPRRLDVLPGGAGSPAFSPDGTRLSALTLVGPGKVGVVVWELRRMSHRVLADINVELLLCKFRSARSAYGAPADFFEMPRQYLWVDAGSLLFVDHGPTQQLVLAASDLSSTEQGLRWRTDDGLASVRVWDDRSPTCGAGSRLVRMTLETGKVETLYEGDVRGVSLSPDRRWLALLVATRNIRPNADEPMQWPLLATSGLDDAMVELKMTLLDLAHPGSARDIEGIASVGNCAPSRLPRWSLAGSRIGIPVRTTYSDAPSTGNDAAWEVIPATGAARKWPASSALDAELLAALLTADGLDTSSVIEHRPQKKGSEAYTVGGGQIRGGAWRCAPGHVMFWNAPELMLISPTGTVKLPGRFTSVEPPVGGDSVTRTIVARADGEAFMLTNSRDGYRMETLSTARSWNLLAVSPSNASAIYEDEDYSGTYLKLASPGKPPLRSPLEFNTYFREVRVPPRRIVSCTFPGGDVRSGLLQLPVGHQAGARHPVIVWAYPNATPSLNDPFTRANSSLNVIYPVQYLLAKGFAFFEAPFPIDGDRRFHPMREAVDAVTPWLDVLAKQPEIIPGAYGFFGHSNAGYVGLALEALTDCFKAIVVWDTFPELGYGALHSYANDVVQNCAGNVVQGFRMFYEARNQPYAPQPAPPWKDPSQSIRNDPLFDLSRARTPLLLVEGEFDVSTPEMEEVYSVLYGSGVSVELAYYWGEGHVFVSPGNIQDSWRRTERFFRQYLQAR